MPSLIEKMLIFHRNLGCNDDDATTDERLERILYCYSSPDSNNGDDGSSSSGASNDKKKKIINEGIFAHHWGDRRSRYTGNIFSSAATKNSTQDHSPIGSGVCSDIAIEVSSENEKQLRLLHMVESLIEFSSKFCREKIEFVLCQKYFWCLNECEANVWIAVAVPLSQKKNNFSRNDIQTLIRDMYNVFVTTHGTFDSILSSFLFSTLSSPSISPRNLNISVCINSPSDDDDCYDDIDNDNKMNDDSDNNNNNNNNNSNNTNNNNDIDDNNKNDGKNIKAKYHLINDSKSYDRRSGWALIDDVKVLRKKIKNLTHQKEFLFSDVKNLKKSIESDKCCDRNNVDSNDNNNSNIESDDNNNNNNNDDFVNINCHDGDNVDNYNANQNDNNYNNNDNNSHNGNNNDNNNNDKNGADTNIESDDNSNIDDNNNDHHNNNNDNNDNNNNDNNKNIENDHKDNVDDNNNDNNDVIDMNIDMNMNMNNISKENDKKNDVNYSVRSHSDDKNDGNNSDNNNGLGHDNNDNTNKNNNDNNNNNDDNNNNNNNKNNSNNSHINNNNNNNNNKNSHINDINSHINISNNDNNNNNNNNNNDNNNSSHINNSNNDNNNSNNNTCDYHANYVNNDSVFYDKNTPEVLINYRKKCIILNEIFHLENRISLLNEEIESEKILLNSFLSFDCVRKSYHNHRSKNLEINDEIVLDDLCHLKIMNFDKITDIAQLPLKDEWSYVYTPFVLRNFLSRFFSWYDFDNFQFLYGGECDDFSLETVRKDTNNVKNDGMIKYENIDIDNKKKSDDTNCSDKDIIDYDNINNDNSNSYDNNSNDGNNDNNSNNSDKNDNSNINDKYNMKLNLIKKKLPRKIHTFMDEERFSRNITPDTKTSKSGIRMSPNSSYQRIMNYFK